MNTVLGTKTGNTMYKDNDFSFLPILNGRPAAFAMIEGSRLYKNINGTAQFFATPYGTLCAFKISGLPEGDDMCDGHFFALHIHEGESCSGNRDDYFANSGSHYNPYGCPHPYHAGDLPPLISANGRAFAVFLTDRFTAEEIINKTVVIHSDPDDFTSQPSGNSGTKIACGIIKKYN